jgi:isocitrate dehydrogenase
MAITSKLIHEYQNARAVQWWSLISGQEKHPITNATITVDWALPSQTLEVLKF